MRAHRPFPPRLHDAPAEHLLRGMLSTWLLEKHLLPTFWCLDVTLYMRMSLCMYACFIYIHTYTHAYMHIIAHKNIDTYIHTYLCVLICLCSQACFGYGCISVCVCISLHIGEADKSTCNMYTSLYLKNFSITRVIYPLCL